MSIFSTCRHDKMKLRLVCMGKFVVVVVVVLFQLTFDIYN